MLHEILLSLSGIPSPIFERDGKDENIKNGTVHAHLSEPEQALLQTLSELSSLHGRVRDSTTRISPSHSSMICRAVSASISSDILEQFRTQLVDVETAILQKDARYVGGYGIVPLSTITTEFAPWTRRLQWLWKICSLMQDEKTSSVGCQILDVLDTHRQTGYSDIERMATSLLVVAQRAWMRSNSLWVLYGELPSVGSEDFMITKSNSDLSAYSLKAEATPSFVTKEAAHATLMIGTALIQLRSPMVNPPGKAVSLDASTKLLPDSLATIKELIYPVVPSLLESAMLSINRSISRKALSKLLPTEAMFELLGVTRDYLLLHRGEFAVSLIDQAQARLNARNQGQAASRPVRKVGRHDGFCIRETELMTILSKTWSDMINLQPGFETEDPSFSQARSMMRLRLASEPEPPIATVLPTPVVLDLEYPSGSPLSIFLPKSTIKIYSAINAYLLSIRRACLQLSSLWQLTPHRRCYPTPIGPPLSTRPVGQRSLRDRRKRENQRHSQMRPLWATASKAQLVFSELNGYLHGEVIAESWKLFAHWLHRRPLDSSHRDHTSPRPASCSSHIAGLSKSAESCTPDARASRPTPDHLQRDPRILAQAHQRCLEGLETALLLRNGTFTICLKDLLHTIDHLVALFDRLQTVWEGLDLQEEDGVMDAFSNYADEERGVTAEMCRTRDVVEAELGRFADVIRNIEKERDFFVMTSGVARLGQSHGDDAFVPWQARTLDRLIMKLDFLSAKDTAVDDVVDEDEFFDAL